MQLFSKMFGAAALVAAALVLSPIAQTRAEEGAVSEGGVVMVKSAFVIGETITRLKEDIASKKLMFFSEINQSQLAAEARIRLRPSTLLVFGNPALGSQFMTSNPAAGIDWPVRLLVFEDAQDVGEGVYYAEARDIRRIAQGFLRDCGDVEVLYCRVGDFGGLEQLRQRVESCVGNLGDAGSDGGRADARLLVDAGQNREQACLADHGEADDCCLHELRFLCGNVDVLQDLFDDTK